MGILNSIVLGKSRKSAGGATFYVRLGVPCFRQKPVRSEGYKSSVPQRMQQSVFRFTKANVDASGIKSFVDMFYDAKPRKGKSETKFNMFYRAFMPHLVANKTNIYELPQDDIINPVLFLGTPATNRDKLTNGQLGTLIIESGSASSMVISEVVLNQLIDKANALLSVSDTPFTINNLFIGVVGADAESASGYKIAQGVNIVPTLADGVYTFDLSAVSGDMDSSVNIYAALMLAGVDPSGGIDLRKRKFATDSVILNETFSPVTDVAIASVSGPSAGKLSITVDATALEAAGLGVQQLSNTKLVEPDGVTARFTNGVATKSGNTFTITFDSSTGEEQELESGTLMSLRANDGKNPSAIIIQFTNGIGDRRPVIE